MVNKEKKGTKVAIVYMVAGLSSRFGGKIKQFAQVGPNGETLIEVSMQQAIKAGFKEIIFIVGEKTEVPFKDKFSAGYNETPIYYANQILDPTTRDKPWGTTDALVSAKDVITSPFAVCNGDDLYGENALKKVREFLEKSENEKDCVAIGYELGKVLPKIGKTNRGIFKTNKNDNIISIEEVFEIEKNNLKEKNLQEKDLCSMNLFGLTENTLELLEKKLNEFKETHKGDRKAECLLPVELSNLIKEKKITMKLLPTKDNWFGVTNPEDELVVRKALLKKN